MAEEAVQDALVRALKVWTYQGIPPNPAGWLNTTANNAALDKLRQYDITHLVVVKDNQYLGILHLHDLVREGLI